MSAINSFGTEKSWYNVIPGFSLVQLVDVRGEYKVGYGKEQIMKEGYYGLTLSNDPAFIFKFIPLYDYTDEEYESLSPEEAEQDLEANSYWRDQFSIGQEGDFWYLFKACAELGYDYSVDGAIGCWIGQHLTKVIPSLGEPDSISEVDSDESLP